MCVQAAMDTFAFPAWRAMVKSNAPGLIKVECILLNVHLEFNLRAVAKSLDESICFCWLADMYRQKVRHQYRIHVCFGIFVYNIVLKILSL